MAFQTLPFINILSHETVKELTKKTTNILLEIKIPSKRVIWQLIVLTVSTCIPRVKGFVVFDVTPLMRMDLECDIYSTNLRYRYMSHVTNQLVSLQ